ncbi:unnamed protein product [Darwinula stevensoni]|uniref:Uncharacterized protein n=1 Tax=Darwinula stevensoni TaxID=69355 RepID=A0A7R9FRY1_9CRUS|nr:unnamed protein product [Darwinula stevensoni]CAG0902341.1 unnamed protein product [Darwinula stevensoni]
MEIIGELMKDNTQLKLDITQLKDDNSQLKLDNENLKSQLENRVEDRLQYLEAVTRQIVPTSCETLARLGVTRSGTYLVDPDGVLRGDQPIQVFCDMVTDTASTYVLHNSMEATEIYHCPDPGCYARRVTYDASIKQMQALIDQSESCEQQIRYDCFSAALTSGDTHYAWWVGRHGDPQHYWDGSHAGEHVCSCGLTSDCVNSAKACNCDAEAHQWESDFGVITNGSILPITELRFGGLQVEGQRAKHTLGALVCRGHTPSSNPIPTWDSKRALVPESLKKAFISMPIANQIASVQQGQFLSMGQR